MCRWLSDSDRHISLGFAVKMKRVAGLILAAGKSERMGRPKALLPFRGSCFLTHVLTEAAHSELTERVPVVLRARREMPGAPGCRKASLRMPCDYKPGRHKTTSDATRDAVPGSMYVVASTPINSCTIC